jgi:2-methylcitrate dehydratase PrpD/DNA-binding GntR family transcriptional regulator
MTDAIAKLTEHVVRRAETTLPDDVDQTVRLLMLDAVGCGLAGLGTPEWAAAREFAVGPAIDGGAIMMGEPRLQSPEAAAFANTMAARAQLYDDTYGPGHLHGGAALTFTALAVAESEGRPLNEVLRAVALGAEVAYRVGAAAGEEHYASGFHNTGTCVVFGTATTAALLLGLSTATIRGAMSLAGEHAAGLRRYQHGGSPANSALHAANAAEWGLRCARLAAAGFPAAPGMLEGTHGFLRTFGAEPDADEILTRDLDDGWLVLESSVKAYPSCRSTHGSATAIGQLREDAGLTAQDVAGITVTVSPHAYKCDRPDPASELDAQYSIQYVLAYLLVHGQLRADDFGAEGRRDPRVRELLPLIEVRCGEALRETHTELEVTTRDGRRLGRTIRIGEVLGDHGNPLSPRQIRHKYTANATSALSADGADKLAGHILAAEGDSAAVDTLALTRPLPRLTDPQTFGIQRRIAAYYEAFGKDDVASRRSPGVARTTDSESKSTQPRGLRRPEPPYERLKAAILSGELQPGQPLVEMALAEWIGVSRTPIREALRRLQQDGLIVRNDRGMTVRERSPEEILDIYDTRLVLEAMAGRVAADRRTAYDLRAMRLWLERGDQVSPDDRAGMVEANLAFHTAIWRASHNESLTDLLDRLNLHLSRYPGTTLAAPGRWSEARGEHQALVNAIEARDAEGAHEIALKHFERARGIRLRLFDEGMT